MFKFPTFYTVDVPLQIPALPIIGRGAGTLPLKVQRIADKLYKADCLTGRLAREARTVQAGSRPVCFHIILRRRLITDPSSGQWRVRQTRPPILIGSRREAGAV